MAVPSLLKSLVFGAGGGILYGYSFLGHTALLSKISSRVPRKGRFFLFSLSSFFRFVLLALLWLYVLRTPSLNIILVLVSFFGGFWLMILHKKVRSHEH